MYDAPTVTTVEVGETEPEDEGLGDVESLCDNDEDDEGVYDAPTVTTVPLAHADGV